MDAEDFKTCLISIGYNLVKPWALFQVWTFVCVWDQSDVVMGWRRFSLTFLFLCLYILVLIFIFYWHALIKIFLLKKCFSFKHEVQQCIFVLNIKQPNLSLMSTCRICVICCLSWRVVVWTVTATLELHGSSFLPPGWEWVLPHYEHSGSQPDGPRHLPGLHRLHVPRDGRHGHCRPSHGLLQSSGRG